MWPLYYVRALEIIEERTREANLQRLIRDGRTVDFETSSRVDALRRRGAVVAATIARRLDECVARETVGRGSEDGLTVAG